MQSRCQRAKGTPYHPAFIFSFILFSTRSRKALSSGNRQRNTHQTLARRNRHHAISRIFMAARKSLSSLEVSLRFSKYLQISFLRGLWQKTLDIGGGGALFHLGALLVQDLPCLLRLGEYCAHKELGRILPNMQMSRLETKPICMAVSFCPHSASNPGNCTAQTGFQLEW